MGQVLVFFPTSGAARALRALCFRALVVVPAGHSAWARRPACGRMAGPFGLAAP